MRAELVKTPETTEEMSSHPGETAFGRTKRHRNTLRQRKTENGLEKGLANLRSRKKITKKAHAGRGQEIKWEIPDQKKV
jgi:hypothetical protein